MDGIEVIISMRKEGIDLRVIAISGGAIMSKELLLSNAAALGAVEVVTKPFEMRQVMGAVERALNPSRAEVLAGSHPFLVGVDDLRRIHLSSAVSG